MARVLITRAPHQASALADRLRALGHQPVLIPTIEIAPPSSFASLDAALAGLHGFPWIVFTSANAVAAFVERLASRDCLLPAACRFAAIGAATARAIEERLGVSSILVPAQSVAESLADALLPHAVQSDGSPTRLLLVRAEQAREILPEALRSAGAEVTIATAYRNVVPAGSVDALRALFAGPSTWPDAIAFTSGSTVAHLKALLDEAGIALPECVLRVSIGPITSQTMRDLGMPPHGEAAAPTVEALADAVARAINFTTAAP